MMKCQYEQSLIAMHKLLAKFGITHWASWIETDINEWQSKQIVSHHRSAYGGMGSFNDIWICVENEHHVTKEIEPWANCVFDWLKSLCYFLSANPHEFFDAKRLGENIGQHDPSLSAFVGGENAPDSMRGLFSSSRKLTGWRCLVCGHSETSNRAIDQYIADSLVPNMLFEACENSRLVETIDDILNGRIDSLEAIRNEMKSAIDASEIQIVNRVGWMRPCPTCDTDDTAVYRWQGSQNGESRFTPSDDNLPLRKNAT